MSSSGSLRYPCLFARHFLLASLVIISKRCPGEYRTGNSVTLEQYVVYAVGDLSRYDAKVVLSYTRLKIIHVTIPVMLQCFCNDVRNTPFKLRPDNCLLQLHFRLLFFPGEIFGELSDIPAYPINYILFMVIFNLIHQYIYNI